MGWYQRRVHGESGQKMRVFELTLLTLSVLLPAIAAKARGPDYTDIFVKDLNEKIPNQQWVAGKHFESFDDVRPLLGVKERAQHKIVYRAGSLEDVKNYKAPASFDLRQVWKNCTSLQMVWDQGGCGSDWAIASTSAFSDRICMLREARPEDGQQIISPQDLMTCCWRCGDTPTGGTCQAGDPYECWAWFDQVGVTTGGPYGDTNTCKPYSFAPCDHLGPGKYGPCPFNPAMPTCEHECKNDYYNRHGQTYATDKRNTRDHYYVRSSEDHIMYELQTRGSITAVFNVYADFPVYKSGVYQHVSGDILGVHAVRLVGWGTEGGVKFWWAINSWNESWGDKGAFKIRRGANECGIESKLYGGQAKYMDPFGP